MNPYTIYQYPHVRLYYSEQATQNSVMIDWPQVQPNCSLSAFSAAAQQQTRRVIKIGTPEFVLKAPCTQITGRKIAIPRRSQVPRKSDGPSNLEQPKIISDDGDERDLLVSRRKLSDARKVILKRHRNNNKLKQRKKRRAEARRPVPPAMKVPCEVFTKICAHLSPSDLYSLTRICKRWRNWLVAPNNKQTQLIWRDSRKKFIQRMKDPPTDVDEFKWYIRRWKKVPDWMRDCFFCFSTTARKSCRFKDSWVRTCKHCHDFYSRRARKKYPQIYNAQNPQKPEKKHHILPRRRRGKGWWN